MSTDNDHKPTIEASQQAADRALEEQLILERRAFLKQLGAIGLLTAGASYVTLAPSSWPLSIRDRDGEEGKPEVDVFRLPEGGFGVQASSVLPVMGIARGHYVDAGVRAAVDQIGGISRFIQSGDVVVIKPNVAFERGPALGATTNPEVLKSLIYLVREGGAKEVRVCDNPIESPESCFFRSGIRQAAIDAGARVYLPTPSDFETLNVAGAKWIENWPFFWNPFRGANKVIGVAPVKDHNLCGASMTTKNWYGLLGGRRNQFHQDIHGIITDLALMMNPTFVVLDGTLVMYKSGPTGGSLGDVYEGNTIVASTDSLACDAFGWNDLLRRPDSERPEYFANVAARGLGNPHWQDVARKEVQVG